MKTDKPVPTGDAVRFHTNFGSPLRLLSINTKMDIVWVEFHPDEPSKQSKSKMTHIDIRDIREGRAAVFAHLKMEDTRPHHVDVPTFPVFVSKDDEKVESPQDNDDGKEETFEITD